MNLRTLTLALTIGLTGAFAAAEKLAENPLQQKPLAALNPALGPGIVTMGQIKLPAIVSRPDQRSSRYFFHNGARYQARRADLGSVRQPIEPKCSLMVAYSYQDVTNMDETGRYPALTLKTSFRISPSQTSWSVDTNKPARLTSISYSVNNVNAVTMGEPLFYDDGRISESRLMSIECEFHELRFSDIEASLPGAVSVLRR